MRGRRVLHIIPSLAGEYADHGTAIRQLAGRLAELGVETHVATTRRSDRSGPVHAPVVEKGVSYWQFQRHVSLSTLSWPLWSWLSKEVASFDVVHIHSLFSWATLPAAVLARRHGVPYIIRPLERSDECEGSHRLALWRRLRMAILRARVLRHAALMHFNSEDERQQAERLNVSMPSVVIPPAMSSAPMAASGGILRRRLGLAGSRRIALVTLPTEERALGILLRAVVQMRALVSDAVVVLIGDAPSGMLARLRTEMRSLGLSDYEVFWVGPLDDGERRAALADARVLVALADGDGQHTFVKEAMEAGLPVVVSDALSIHAEVEQANAGIAVPVEVVPLARAVGSVLAHPALGAAMGAAGVDLIRRSYSPDAVARRLMTAYEQVCGGIEPAQVSLDVLGADC